LVLGFIWYNVLGFRFWVYDARFIVMKWVLKQLIAGFEV
jgi:hypothetical protein